MNLPYPALLLTTASLFGLAVDCIQAQAPSATSQPAATPWADGPGVPVADIPGERHFRNVRQLTFGGENAEAYWSFSGEELIYQSKRGGLDCDQIFALNVKTGRERLVSTGKGRTTCAYFLKGDEAVVYASTHLGSMACPPVVARIGGKYVWAIYEDYDIFVSNPDGTGLKPLTKNPGYDAEATVCPVTGDIIFTSMRDGDLELYTMKPDGSNITRLTDRVGYDGGAFFSHDGKKIVQRSGFFANDAEQAEYQELLKKGIVQPSKMEITVLNRDGSGFKKVTNNGKANFAPFFHPDNERILFSSNKDAPRGRDFEIYMVKEDGTGEVRITRNPSFDGFPMFSPDGKHLVFSSNRNGKERGETNVFLAEWVETGDAGIPLEDAPEAHAHDASGGRK